MAKEDRSESRLDRSKYMHYENHSCVYQYALITIIKQKITTIILRILNGMQCPYMVSENMKLFLTKSKLASL
jgi:hypothetical protein